MTTITDPRTAGQLARYDVLRAVMGHTSTVVVGDRVAALVAQLGEDHGPAAVAALVEDLANEAVTHHRHHAVARTSTVAAGIADALEVEWSRATSATLRYLDEGEVDERRAAQHDARHEVADGALTAA